jgi:hypothetical protein
VFTSIDLFSQRVTFRASKESENHRSLIGTLFTLLIVSLTAPYAFN